MRYVRANEILSSQNEMDIYRGCSHGCIYCNARSKCPGIRRTFMDIEVKKNAPELLEQIMRERKKPCMIHVGTTFDPYIPLEDKTKLTRQCLERIDQYEFGLTIQTKSDRILNDLDLLESINEKARCVVLMPVTTGEDRLCRIMEPNVSTAGERFKAIKTLQEHGIPAIVKLTPVLPFINDNQENVKNILDACFDAGVKGIYSPDMKVSLSAEERRAFYAALDKYFPGMRIRYIRNFGNACEFKSPEAGRLLKLIRMTCRQQGIMYKSGEVRSYLKKYPQKYEQLELWDFFG